MQLQYPENLLNITSYHKFPPYSTLKECNQTWWVVQSQSKDWSFEIKSLTFWKDINFPKYRDYFWLESLFVYFALPSQIIAKKLLIFSTSE